MLSGMFSVGTVSSQTHQGLGPVVMHLLPDRTRTSGSAELTSGRVPPVGHASC